MPAKKTIVRPEGVGPTDLPCTRCGTWLSVDCFYPNAGGGLYRHGRGSHCKDCINTIARDRRSERRAGIDVLPKRRLPRKHLDGAELVRLHDEERWSIKKIAAHYAVSPERVREVLYLAGVVARRYCTGNLTNLTADGYVLCRIFDDDPLYPDSYDGYMLQHRYVMAQALGRPLKQHETVHHIDGNRANNAVTNLQLRFGSHGPGAAFVCADCGSHNVVPVPIKDAA